MIWGVWQCSVRVAWMINSPSLSRAASGEESPGCDGLGVFEQTVVRLPGGVKHPQMQWNVLDRRRPDHPMFAGQPAETWMYFVHSFAAEDSADVVATCDYGAPLVAAVARDDLWAVQFHPEKSGRTGCGCSRAS